MAYSSLDPIISGVRKLIDTDERKLAAEKEALAGLERVRAFEQEERIARSLGLPNQPSIHTDDFSYYQHITTPIELYLQRRPDGAAKEEIQEALKRGGWEFGKYPKRDVATAIGSKRDVFVEENGLVFLKRLKQSNPPTA